MSVHCNWNCVNCLSAIVIRFLDLCRLEKIREVVETVETYSSLGLSHIEGIDTLHSRFQLAFTTVRKKPYDPLDQRKSDFDNDFQEFKRQTREILVSTPHARNVCCTKLANLVIQEINFGSHK